MRVLYAIARAAYVVLMSFIGAVLLVAAGVGLYEMAQALWETAR